MKSGIPSFLNPIDFSIFRAETRRADYASFLSCLSVFSLYINIILQVLNVQGNETFHFLLSRAWEYKDPYATVEYKVNEATRKRALAIAIQNAAIKQ